MCAMYCLQQPLVVTCDACRSLDELIAQLHYKLKIPPERKFAIFTELAEDGACLILESTIR